MTNKVKLIDVNKEIRRIQSVLEEHQNDKDSTAYYVLSELVECLNNIPSVDALEVVHGRWERVDHDGSWRVDKCSICHKRMHYVDYDQPYPYCPHCGALMDGGTVDD